MGLCINCHSVILDARRHHASEQPPKAALSESQSECSGPKDLILYFLHKTIILHNLFRAVGDAHPYGKARVLSF